MDDIERQKKLMTFAKLFSTLGAGTPMGQQLGDNASAQLAQLQEEEQKQAEEKAKKGSGLGKVLGAGGSGVGAAVGFAFGGPVGAAIGAQLGNMAGSTGGRALGGGDAKLALKETLTPESMGMTMGGAAVGGLAQNVGAGATTGGDLMRSGRSLSAPGAMVNMPKDVVGTAVMPVTQAPSAMKVGLGTGVRRLTAPEAGAETPKKPTSVSSPGPLAQYIGGMPPAQQQVFSRNAAASAQQAFGGMSLSPGSVDIANMLLEQRQLSGLLSLGLDENGQVTFSPAGGF